MLHCPQSKAISPDMTYPSWLEIVAQLILVVVNPNVRNDIILFRKYRRINNGLGNMVPTPALRMTRDVKRMLSAFAHAQASDSCSREVLHS
jgi:hypothetical protein